jgi:putative spermidine/putrescine transport system substrate-binding protein
MRMRTDVDGVRRPGTVTRRELLRRATAAGLGAATCGVWPEAFGAVSAQAKSLSIMSWGWGYADGLKSRLIPKFSQDHSGVNVTLEIGTNAANYAKLLAERSRPVISGGTFNYLYSYRGAADGLWEPFDLANVPNAKNLIHGAIMPDTHGIIFGIQPYGIIYNPDRVDAPTSWLDLFNPKYKGKVGLSDGYFDGYGMTAKAVGRDVNDIAAGIKAWAAHKDNIGPWPQSPAQTEDLVDKGELWLAWDFGGIAEGARDSGKKIRFTIPKEGATAVADVVHSIKGFDPTTTQLTQQFLGSFVSDEGQLLWVKNVYDSPVSRTVKIPPELANRPSVLSPEKVARLLRPDFRYISSNIGLWKNLINQHLK